MRIALVANTAWYLWNFRIGTLLHLQSLGHSVVAVSPPDDYVRHLEDAGIRHLPVRMRGSSVNPLIESVSVFDLVRLFRKSTFDLVFSFTPKANIYGSIACAAAGVPIAVNVSGLGSVFSGRSMLSHLVMLIYRVVLGRAEHVFFQNREDMARFLDNGLVAEIRASLLPGSGVDLDRFVPRSRPEEDTDHAGVEFLLMARLLRDKGVEEYIAAARRVKASHPNARFRLLGEVGTENPRAVPADALAAWVEEGIVRWDGKSDDVRTALAEVDCVVLPSYYREGTPRSLLEAAATGLPIIATDMPGCRDVVEDGVNGFLCKPRDVDSLESALVRMLALSPMERFTMGQAGRLCMESRYDERIVIERYVDVVDAVGARSTGAPR